MAARTNDEGLARGPYTLTCASAKARGNYNPPDVAEEEIATVLEIESEGFVHLQ